MYLARFYLLKEKEEKFDFLVMSFDTNIELIQSSSFSQSIFLLFPYLENGMLLCMILIRLRKEGRR